MDYLCAVQTLVQRRRTLIDALEHAVPASSHAETVARLRCFRGIDTLTAAGLCAEVGDFTRFAKPALLLGFVGVVPSEYTSDDESGRSWETCSGGVTSFSRVAPTSLPCADSREGRSWPGVPGGCPDACGWSESRVADRHE